MLLLSFRGLVRIGSKYSASSTVRLCWHPNSDDYVVLVERKSVNSNCACYKFPRSSFSSPAAEHLIGTNWSPLPSRLLSLVELIDGSATQANIQRSIRCIKNHFNQLFCMSAAIISIDEECCNSLPRRRHLCRNPG